MIVEHLTLTYYPYSSVTIGKYQLGVFAATVAPSTKFVNFCAAKTKQHFLGVLPARVQPKTKALVALFHNYFE
jgi:hypothetical protein